MVEFKDLNLERKIEKKSFEYNGQEIEVLQYLPIDEKDDLIDITLQKAEDNGIYNPLLLEKYFNLNIIYCYTNINFSLEDRQDESDLYDILSTNGIIDKVISLMNDDEYDNLVQMINEYEEKINHYRTTAASVLRAAIIDLPKNAEKAVDLLKQLDPNQFKELTNIAKTLDIKGDSFLDNLK